MKDEIGKSPIGSVAFYLRKYLIIGLFRIAVDNRSAHFLGGTQEEMNKFTSQEKRQHPYQHPHANEQQSEKISVEMLTVELHHSTKKEANVACVRRVCRLSFIVHSVFPIA